MSDITRILSNIDRGDLAAASQLLPIVYDELRKLAAAKLSHENPGNTLQATALVHEAYMRLLGVDESQRWESRGHFFAAAAEAMRRILVDAARRKNRIKHGGDHNRQELDPDAVVLPAPTEELLAVNEVLDELEAANAQAAELVKLRYFAGFTIPETAASMRISPRKANQIWAYARAWLAAAISDNTPH